MLLDRRNFLKSSTAVALTLGAPRGFGFVQHYNDDALRDDLSRRCFQYLWDASDPETGTAAI
jgi:hypothetical protein